jgi:outer membrane protein assembly factor BamE (lipoprotein component of BamABCDE complex)
MSHFDRETRDRRTAGRTRPRTVGRHPARAGLAAALVLSLGLGGCLTSYQTHGYVLTEDALSQIPEGSSREQVLLALGTPSTTGTLTGEVFYYISQKVATTAFLAPSIVEQRVLAVYFDEEQTVDRIANYGLKDGKVFDFISRKTATGGQDFQIITQILSAAGRVSPF